LDLLFSILGDFALVVRKLSLDRPLAVFLPDPAESYEAREIALRFFDDSNRRRPE